MRRLYFAVLAALIGGAAETAAGCGGGAHVMPARSATSSPAPNANARTAAVTFSFTIPAPGQPPRAARRAPKYLTASVGSMTVKVLAGPTTLPASKTYPIPGSICTGSGNLTCSFSTPLPIGTDLVEVTAYDGSSNVVSQLATEASITEGHANTIGTSASPVTLDANPSTPSFSVTSGNTAGSAPNYVPTNTSAVTFSITPLDVDGGSIGSEPGAPTVAATAPPSTNGSAALSGSSSPYTVTFTQASSGWSTGIFETVPKSGTDVTTTSSAAASSGAQTITLTSVAGLYVGANILLDYETYGSGTLIQEPDEVTAIDTSTKVLTLASKLLYAHASGASVAHYGDNLTPAGTLFTLLPQIAVPIANPDYSTLGKAIGYTFSTSFSSFGSTLNDSSGFFGFDRLDGANRLFIADTDNDDIVWTPITSAGIGAITTWTLPQGQTPGQLGLDVSSQGTAAVLNSQSNYEQVTPELEAFRPGVSAPIVQYTSANYPAYSSWFAESDAESSVAVLTNGSGDTFGYAFGIYNDLDEANDVIVVTNGTSGNESDLTSGITSEYDSFNTFGAAPLTWDQGRQQLIYANQLGSGSGCPVESPCAFNVVYFPLSSTTAQPLLSNAATSIGTVAGGPYALTTSLDGKYLAVGYQYNGTTDTSCYPNASSEIPCFQLIIYTWSGSSWSSTYTLPQQQSNIISLHFLPGDELSIAYEDGSGCPQMEIMQPSGSVVVSAYDPISTFGGSCGAEGTYTVNDVAATY